MNNRVPTNQVLTIWCFAFVLVGAILYFVSKGNFIPAGIVTALVPVLVMARSPEKWWLVTILALNSGFMVPGLGGNMSVSMAASIGFAGLMLMEQVFRRTSSHVQGHPHYMVFGFIVLLGFLAFYRGCGFKFLGSSYWGGMQYVQLIFSLSFFYYSSQVKVPAKRLEKVVKLYFWLTLVPVVLTMLTPYISGLSFLRGVIRIQDLSQIEGADSGGMHRFQSLHLPAAVLGYLSFLLFDREFKFSVKMICVTGGSFVLAGLSGHRVVIAKLGLMAAVYSIIRWRKIPLVQRLRVVFVAVCLLGTLYVSVNKMPFEYQRMVSILPGINADAMAVRDAESSSNWRLDLWRELVPMIPEYLWAGRGLGYNLREAYGAYTLASDSKTQHQFLIATHGYHSGPLMVLLDFGLPGALLLSGFFITAIRRYGKRLSWGYSPFMSSAYVVFYSIFVSYILFFLLVFGYIGDLVKIFMIASVLEVISKQAKVSESLIDPRKAVQKEERLLRAKSWRREGRRES